MPPLDDSNRTPLRLTAPAPDGDTTASVLHSSASGDPPPPTTVSHHRSATAPENGPPALALPGYECLGLIADGGMGSVYRYRDLAMGRVVAVKVLRLHVFDAAAARAKFAREVRTMAALEHPNLVPVYHSGEQGGVPYFVMKHMAGGTLPAARAGRRHPPHRAAELLRDVARGVAALHARGILHRDLKPSNVLLDDRGVPHAADFGLAKWLDEGEHTHTGIRSGTPPYMSPEQVAGRSRGLTPACDVWALGVIGYELVSARRPFDVPDDDREELFRRIREDPPPPLADVPTPLVEILHRCLTKDPLRRYPTAAELADDLDAFLTGQPVSAAADTTVTLPAPPSRRRFLKVALGTTGVAASAGLGYVLLREKLGPPPPPPPELTFAERVVEMLKAGGSVQLVGETGPPKWWAMVPPGGLREVPAADGTYTVQPNPDGPTLHPVGWLELLSAPIPCPFIVEAEVCYRAVEKPTGFAAVYLGRRTWPSASGPWQTAFRLKHEPPFGGKKLDRVRIDVAANLDGPTLTQDGHILGEGPQRPLPGGELLNRWVRLQFIVKHHELFGWCDGVPISVPHTRNGGRLKETVPKQILVSMRGPEKDRPKLPDFASAPSLFGEGVGVYVREATVSVRNVRLTPVPPAVPAGDF